MLQIEPLDRGRDRVSKLVAPTDTAYPPLFYGTAGPSVLLDALAGFAAGGLDAGDAVVVIATAQHLRELRRRLARRPPAGSSRERGQLYQFDAGSTLGRFLVGGWPDEARFDAWLRPLVARASDEGRRRVRAFDEMVAFLGRRGEFSAMLRLEQLWNRFSQLEERFSILVASSKIGPSAPVAFRHAVEPRPEQYLG